MCYPRTFGLIAAMGVQALARIPECRRIYLRSLAEMVFFSLWYRQAFETYYECRLWEVPRSEWRYYYGSPYNSHQRRALARAVQPVAYRRLFQDKVVCAILCRGADIRTPTTCGVVSPGEPYREMLADWCRQSPSQSIIVKPRLGSSGHGVHLVRNEDGTLVVQSAAGRVELSGFALREAALVQEAVRQDARLAAHASSVNTVRVVTMLPATTAHPIILYAFLRFGVGHSCVDNFSAGGVAARINLASGELLMPARDKRNRQFTSHPTSGVPFAGFRVPNWIGITTFALRVQRTFDFYRLLGLDIALAADGSPTLIEVNASMDLDGVEAGALLADERVLRAFGDSSLLVNGAQKKPYARFKALARAAKPEDV